MSASCRGEHLGNRRQCSEHPRRAETRASHPRNAACPGSIRNFVRPGLSGSRRAIAKRSRTSRADVEHYASTKYEYDLVAKINDGLKKFFSQLRDLSARPATDDHPRTVRDLDESILTQAVLPYTKKYLDFNATELERSEPAKRNDGLAAGDGAGAVRHLRRGRGRVGRLWACTGDSTKHLSTQYSAARRRRPAESRRRTRGDRRAIRAWRILEAGIKKIAAEVAFHHRKVSCHASASDSRRPTRRAGSAREPVWPTKCTTH